MFFGKSRMRKPIITREMSPVGTIFSEMDESGKKVLNKTEMRFYDMFLRERDGKDMKVIVQPTRLLPLTGGGTYTPDFLLVGRDGGIESIEVKGGYKGPGYEQGHERWKRTANEWSRFGIAFKMATWNKGHWEIKEFDCETETEKEVAGNE